MGEGTKLGDPAELEFNKDISKKEVEQINAELKATRIGQLSEFEKSLVENEEKKEEGVEKEQPQEQDVVEEVSNKTEDVVQEQITEKQADKPQEKEEEQAEEQATSFELQLEESVLDFQEGDIIKGFVREIEKSGVLIDMNYKSDGFIPNNEFSIVSGETPANSLQIGDEIDVYIEKLETKEGYTRLSRKKAQIELSWTNMQDLIKSKDLIEVNVSSLVNGGIIVAYQGIRGFIPMSHIATDLKDLGDELMGRSLSCIVIHVDRKRRKVIFSNRLAKIRPNKEDVIKLIDSLDVGKIIKGTVSSVKDFGAFVDIGGIEGLVHISELSWSRVNHPNEIISIDDKIDVIVLGVDKEHMKVSLGMKQLQKDPWANVEELYKVGQVVEGTISRVITFGAFVKLSDCIEGLIHISEISNEHIDNIEEYFKPGEKVTAEIIKLQPEDQKIGLSIKALTQQKAVSQTEEKPEEANEEPSNEEAPTEDSQEDSQTEDVVVTEVDDAS